MPPLQDRAKSWSGCQFFPWFDVAITNGSHEPPVLWVRSNYRDVYVPFESPLAR